MKHITFLVLGFVLITCSKQDISPVTPIVPVVQLPNEIYIAGYVDVPVPLGYRQTAAYWKNDQKFELPGGLLTSYANSMAVSGNDVYVVGVIVDVESQLKSAVWKNGEQIEFKLPSDIGSDYNVEITSLVTDKTDVYVCGWVDFELNGQRKEKSLLWKNGELILLNDDNSYFPQARPMSITVSGNDVYVNGMIGYWLNGVFTHVKRVGVYNEVEDLYNYDPWIKSIKVVDDNIYFAGDFLGPAGRLAGYKKNDQDFVLLPSSVFSQSEVADMAISEGDIYIVGKLFNDPMVTTAGCWKNGKVVGVMSIGEGYPLSVAIYKNQAFIAGISRIRYENGTGTQNGVYWINTGESWVDYKPIQVSGSSVASAIFVR